MVIQNPSPEECERMEQHGARIVREAAIAHALVHFPKDVQAFATATTMRAFEDLTKDLSPKNRAALFYSEQ